MPATIDQIIASRKALYDPQRALIQQQVDAIPGQETADVASADAALKLANENIDVTAAERGMTYSGDPLDRRAKYAAISYAPRIAEIKQSSADRRSKLQQGLLGITADETNSAQQIQSDQQKAEADAAYKAQQLQLEREKMASTERAAASRASKAKTPNASEQKAALQQSLNSDLAGAFSGFATRPSFFTEKVIIPQLVAAYPELNAADISKQVYSYRKALGLG